MDNNIEVSWVDSSASVESYEEAIKPNTKVILIMHSWILRTHAHTHTHIRTYIHIQFVSFETFICCRSSDDIY